MTPEQKAKLRKDICKKLENCQNNVRGKKHIKELKLLFYKEQEFAKEYQKYFAGVSWQVMILPFQEKKSLGQEKVCNAFTEFVISAGTDSDIQSFNFPVPNLKPLFLRILALYTKQHSDARTTVRQRTIELVHKILNIHHSHPKFVSDEELKTKLILALRERIRDKIPIIRTLALKCFAYLITDLPEELSDVIQDLKFHAEVDPHSDARKSALSSLTKRSDIPVNFYVKKMYDSDENVRIEAFKAFLNVPFQMLLQQSSSPLLKIVQWGLLQTSHKIRQLLTQELIPMWIDASNGIINFLSHLDVARNTQTTGLLFQAMYPDDSEETFARADLSFLTDEKIIEVNDIKVEKTIYWVFLCRKFQSRPYCKEKIFPDVAALIGLMNTLITVIHDENKEATITERDEDIENILCLGQILRIACICEYEEGSIRQMKNLISTMLQDKILDESFIIHSAVDLMHKIEPDEFNTFMVNVIKKVLETPEPIILNNHMNEKETEKTDHDDDDDDDIVFIKEVRKNNSSSSSSMNINSVVNIKIEYNRHQHSNGISSPVPHHSTINQDNNDENDINIICDNNAHSSVRSRPLTEDETRMFKNERGEIIVKQHKVNNAMDEAIKKKNYLQANELKTEHVSLQQRRTVIDRILKDGILTTTSVIKQTNSTLNQLDKETQNLTISPIQNNVTCINFTDSIPHHNRNQVTVNEREAEQTHVGDHNEYNETVLHTSPSTTYFRGIVMFFRYLSWQQEITPFTRKMYENFIFECLQNDDYRIRLYAVLVVGLIGLIDVIEAKKSLAVMIHALTPDEDERVRATAFKVIIDLLLRYSYSVFRVSDEEDISLWPTPLKNFHSEISEDEMEKLILELLHSFNNSEDIGSKNWCLKYSGFMKLLIRGRIRVEAKEVLSQILDIWSNTNFSGTPLLRTISYFLPIYAKLSLGNASRIEKAFIACVTKSKTISEETVGDENGNGSIQQVEEKSENHFMALANFVFPQISEKALKQFPQGSTIQSELALDIINEIAGNITLRDRNIIFVKMLRLLDIHEPYITKVRIQIQAILNDIVTYEGMTKFQTAISGLQKYFTKKFGILQEEERNDNEEEENSRAVITDNDDSLMDITENFEQLQNQQQRMRSEVDFHGNIEEILSEDDLLLENNPTSSNDSIMSIDSDDGNTKE